VGPGTGSSRSPERAAALHRLRSTLARLKAELELAEADGTVPPVQRLLEDIDEAFELLTEAEDVGHPQTRVIVVDDDERLAEVTARGLRRHGFDADSSGSLRSLERGEVLVIDLGLLDGLDAHTLEAVRAARPIVVTGASNRAGHALASRAAAFDYLVKPVELEDLAAAIGRRLAEG
jgi:CheY-like chemotaxis protein